MVIGCCKSRVAFLGTQKTGHQGVLPWKIFYNLNQNFFEKFVSYFNIVLLFKLFYSVSRYNQGPACVCLSPDSNSLHGQCLKPIFMKLGIHHFPKRHAMLIQTITAELKLSLS